MSKDLSSTKERKRLSTKEFALPGERKYPIPDKAHARNALARVAQNGTAEEQRTVRAAVHKRFPSIGDDSDSRKTSKRRPPNKGKGSGTKASKKAGKSKSGKRKKKSGKKK